MTEQLFDAGELQWPVKLHLGCGGVYLDGYTNIDMHGCIVDSRPEHATSIRDYYRGLSGGMDAIPERRACLCDEFGDLRHVDAHAPIDKIVAIQCVEHLPPSEVAKAFQNWHANMRTGGVAIVSVPDTAKTLRMLSDCEQSEFAVRHLVGRRDTYFHYHRSHWTRDSLVSAFWDAGFKDVHELENFHFYPAIVMKGRA